MLIVNYPQTLLCYNGAGLNSQASLGHKSLSKPPFSSVVLAVEQPATWPHVLFVLFGHAGGMKEQDLMCIKLHGVNRIGLKKIIDFIYTAKLSLNMENLQDTLEAASFLQILPVLDFCKVFLISGVRDL